MNELQCGPVNILQCGVLLAYAWLAVLGVAVFYAVLFGAARAIRRWKGD